MNHERISARKSIRKERNKQKRTNNMEYDSLSTKKRVKKYFSAGTIKELTNLDSAIKPQESLKEAHNKAILKES